MKVTPATASVDTDRRTHVETSLRKLRRIAVKCLEKWYEHSSIPAFQHSSVPCEMTRLLEPLLRRR
jgi:hypothetical protein